MKTEWQVKSNKERRETSHESHFTCAVCASQPYADYSCSTKLRCLPSLGETWPSLEASIISSKAQG